ncbi:pyridoxal phosphate-dependent decarboxylase family protein [Kribbella sp. CA-294648]|uniref:pyridoxal phosphate-dependent decarboxylase family protein n=1 Tax=Kribbella sp. CA-294648 TaxID=3239948 RepID=UPI003D8A166C
MTDALSRPASRHLAREPEYHPAKDSMAYEQGRPELSTPLDAVAPVGLALRRRPLEPIGEDLREMLVVVANYVSDVVDGLPTQSVGDCEGVEDLLADPVIRRMPPERGRPLHELLAVIDRAAGKGINTAHGGLFGFVPGGGLVSAGIADLIADVLNRYTGQATPAPGLVALETDVLRWLADLFHLPAGAAGILTTGTSMATLSAMITARSSLLPGDFLSGAIYVTEQTHDHVAKAAQLLGFAPQAVRIVGVDRRLRMDPAALHETIVADRAAGFLPFFVVASAGTTNTGTVDPIPAIADVAAAEGLWMHVDAAYGGFFQLTKRGRRQLRGIERADSMALDPHKGLFLPFGTGCLLVRNGRLLREAHSTRSPDYLQDLRGSTLPDFGDYGPELSRDFRGLRVWLPLHLHGVAAFRDALDEKLDLARMAYEELAVVPQLVMVGPPDLSIFGFHLRSDTIDANLDDENKGTAELLRRVNAEGKILFSSTRLSGRMIVRMCVLHHRTDLARVSEAVAAIRQHAGDLRPI